MTDLLNHQITLLRLYDPIVPILAAGLRATGSTEILDLCSGGGGPLRLIQAELAARHHLTVAVRLSDLYPNFDAFRRAERAAAGRIRFVPVPVDATQVSDDLDGFRTMFTSLHHFRPDYAREILQDAVDHRRGIGVFEFTERSVAGLASMVLSPLLTLAVTPWIRPWRWSRLLMTYVLPILPATYLFDGVVSQLRTYTPGELCEMTASLSGPPYDWAIGRKRHRLLPINITYLVGHPAQLMPRAVESLREITTERA